MHAFFMFPIFRERKTTNPFRVGGKVLLSALAVGFTVAITGIGAISTALNSDGNCGSLLFSGGFFSSGDGNGGSTWADTGCNTVVVYMNNVGIAGGALNGNVAGSQFNTDVQLNRRTNTNRSILCGQT